MWFSRRLLWYSFKRFSIFLSHLKNDGSIFEYNALQAVFPHTFFSIANKQNCQKKDGPLHIKGESKLADSSPKHINQGTSKYKIEMNSLPPKYILIASRKPKPFISTLPFFTCFWLTAIYAFEFSYTSFHNIHTVTWKPTKNVHFTWKTTRKHRKLRVFGRIVIMEAYNSTPEIRPNQ